MKRLPIFLIVMGLTVSLHSQSDLLLQSSSYLGGSGEDVAADVAVDSEGNQYIVGYTSSTDYPVRNSFQRVFNGGISDAVITKVDSSGRRIIFSTYLGGSDSDVATAVAVDKDGNAYVGGATRSSDFPITSEGFRSKSGSFLAIFSPSGKLQRSSYLRFVPGISHVGL